jgi:predicted O-methyltransferase YrrM
VASDSTRPASSANLPSGSASAVPVTIVPWILPLRQSCPWGGTGPPARAGIAIANGFGSGRVPRPVSAGARLLRVGPLAYAAEYLPEDEPLLAARANAADLGGTEPVLPAVGATLRFLACAVGAKTAVEIGTGCGSSGIWLLRGMRPGSTLTSVDTEPEYQRVARKAFQAAGFAQNQCRLILGRALDVLPRLSDGTYDMVFCDADPRDYPDYLSAALRLLRTGGIVAFNNALLATSSGDDKGDVPAYELASQIRADERLVPVLLPLGDGLLAAVKRSD